MQIAPSFSKLGLTPQLCRTCSKIRYSLPTPIQSLAIPPLLSGNSVIANSETGSGKTAAFGLPLVQLIAKDPYSICGVVLAPSLELALQIGGQLSLFGQSINLRLAVLVGGGNYNQQVEQLEAYPHVVVATPGRLVQMMGKEEKLMKLLSKAKMLILDEADRMLEPTMLPKVQQIVQSLKGLKQMVLATATIDENFQGNKLQQLLGTHMSFTKCSTFEGIKTVSTLTQEYILTPEHYKPAYLLQLLQENSHLKTILFVKSGRQCTLIAETLKFLEIPAIALHSFLRHNERVSSLHQFRSDRFRVLVTTDLTSRGLDVNNVQLVINYSVPRMVSDYVHRVGRTARNGYEGTAISFLTPNETDLFQQIEAQIGVTIEEHTLSGKVDAAALTKFNKAKREIKINLASSGVLAELDKRKEQKKTMKQNVLNGPSSK